MPPRGNGCNLIERCAVFLLSAQIVSEARRSNKRFLSPPREILCLPFTANAVMLLMVLQ
jgi:hypothetical protein